MLELACAERLAPPVFWLAVRFACKLLLLAAEAELELEEAICETVAVVLVAGAALATAPALTHKGRGAASKSKQITKSHAPKLLSDNAEVLDETDLLYFRGLVELALAAEELTKPEVEKIARAGRCIYLVFPFVVLKDSDKIICYNKTNISSHIMCTTTMKANSYSTILKLILASSGKSRICRAKFARNFMPSTASVRNKFSNEYSPPRTNGIFGSNLCFRGKIP